LQTLLTERIARLDVAKARVDIERFIADPQPLAIWSAEYFYQLVGGCLRCGSCLDLDRHRSDLAGRLAALRRIRRIPGGS